MSMWDTLSLTSDVLLGMALPFILGHVLFREVRDLQFFLGALMVGLLVYSLPMLWEVRMSPQLHSQVYGYFPFVAFEQMSRAEGFRPLVFTVHGLSLATVTAYAVVATAALVRIGWKRLPSLPLPATLYLAVVLAFCKSLGPIVFAIIGVPLGILASPRVQVRLAVLVVCVVLLYPAARASGVLPADTFAGVVEIVSTDRAQSLRYRLRNEDLAIANAVAKPFFGWGTHARSHVFDPQTGRDLLTTDGYWMIVLGKQGSVGLIATFGLLAFPVFWTGTALARLKRPADRAALATFAVLSAFVVVDLLPNANVVPLTLVIVGALSGVSARLVERRPIARTARPAPAPAPTGSRPSRRVRPWPLEPVRPEGRPE